MGFIDRAAAWGERHRTDLLCVLGLIAVNPVLFRLDRSLRYYPPDTLAYIELARDLFERGRFFVASWGHVDVGVILPPVYPALLGGLDAALGDSLGAAEWAARLSFLAAVPFLYALARSRTSPLAAFTVCALLPLELSFHRLAFTPLTEATFILSVAATLVLADAVFRKECPTGAAVGLGLLCAISFATRQIGLVFFGFVLAWLCLLHFTPPRLAWKDVARRTLLVTGGFAALALPYSAIVVAQTGSTPFEQRFRIGAYRVEARAPAVRGALDAIRTLPIERYEDVLLRRRELRRLVPDGSEMYQFLVEPGGEPGLAERAATGLLESQSTLAIRLRDNVLHLRTALGWPLLIALVASFATPFVLPVAGRTLASRCALPAACLVYLTVLSGFGSIVARYVEVMIPFLGIHLAAELYRFGERFGLFDRNVWLARGAALALAVAALASLPHRFDALPLYSPHGDAELALSALEGHASLESPAFCLAPLDCYRLGSRFRILPNDRLEQVARYAHATGVEWLLVSQDATHERERARYSRTDWYFDPDLELHGGAILEPCCESGNHRLFRIRPPP